MVLAVVRFREAQIIIGSLFDMNETALYHKAGKIAVIRQALNKWLKTRPAPEVGAGYGVMGKEEWEKAVLLIKNV